jgi:hypothetical protein
METAGELAGPLCVGAAKATVLGEVRADMRKRKWVTTSESQMKRWWAKYKDPFDATPGASQSLEASRTQ